MTDREIDAAVARALGWKDVHESPPGLIRGVPPEWQDTDHPVPTYSRDIAAAWELVEKMAETHEHFIQADEVGFMLADDNERAGISHCDGPTAEQTARAICLAFLKAKGVAV